MDWNFEIKTIKSNNINLRVAIEGEGPLVIMVHGFPELWYSWRHQIKPIASAGYRVLALDVRGYGGSDKPYPIDSYGMSDHMADLIGLIDYFEEEKAILIGHDWGAPIVWNTATLHKNRISAVAGLSVPYRKRGPVSNLQALRQLYKDKFFYQLYFQEEGVAERELESDIRLSLRKMYFSASGDASSLENWVNRAPSTTLLGDFEDPDPFPDWLSDKDLEYYIDNFSAGGFRGPINRYRNQDQDFDNLPMMGVEPVEQPSCFIAGSKDLVRTFVPGIDLYETPDIHCRDMRVSKVIEGAGHWVQQEAPEEVNVALLEFLNSLK
ncbi:MAG: alpha/beta fold hydrolase [Dehalococcoidia bacterium]